MSNINKTLLAYPGGLDTSVILKWLKETYRCPVVAFTADLVYGATALMKTCGKLGAIALFCGLVLWAVPAVAGEAGTVSCSTPGCGYQQDLKIGGGMKSPSVTGYCRSSQQFVRLKLKNWDDYRKPHYCPGSKEPMQPIYEGSEISEIPCPQCGNLTLHYKRTLMFD